ncbi:MATE family efflux transporter [Gottfriedia acidiceleris]|uniref:Probable multidrug resistance protein NorM n=1 Tax=Gottfriedia acidiceleris TaxID=371036 RepID=A0ABY4JQM0_9BACI|nr:MATE family efflux transporter [Gottfriedia acidiceleris]UPM56134.1 MATE family efflux transporter [Gottfriedia acidiceleris]
MKINSYSKTLLILAIPAITESLLQSMVGFVDTFFVSKIGLKEVAAVGISNAILQIYFAVFLAIGTASTVFVSRYYGANDKEKVKTIASQSMILTLFVGAFFGVISFFFSVPILKVMGADKDVLEIGSVYFRIVATPSILMSMMFTIGAILRGSGDTRTPMRVGVSMNVVHMILDYLLIFGVFFEGFGIRGAALSSVLARLFGVILLLRQLLKKEIISRNLKEWKMKLDVIQDLVKLGLPASIERLFMRFGQIIYFGMIIRMGTEVYAAHTLAGNFTIFASVIGTGFAVATTTLVGKSIGSGQIENARKYSQSSITLMSLSMTITLFITCLLSSQISPIFTTDSEVIGLITTVLVIDMITQPATAVVASLTATLQAGGDTKFPMYMTAIGIWAIRTVGVYLLGVYFGFGLVGVWISIAIDNYLRAILLFLRYRSFKWIKSLE